MQKTYQLLLLDFDGVISNSLLVCMEEINRLRRDFPSIPKVKSKEDIVRVYSVKLRHSLYPFGLDDTQTGNFFDKHSQAMNSRATEIEPFYEVVDGLNACNIPKIIVTSSYSEAVYCILKKSSTFHEELIQGVYGREQRKSKTEKIQHALQVFEVDIARALYVGDLASDILYCRDIPIDIACVGYGYHPASYLRQFNPSFILETVEEFVKFLASL